MSSKQRSPRFSGFKTITFVAAALALLLAATTFGAGGSHLAFIDSAAEFLGLQSRIAPVLHDAPVSDTVSRTVSGPSSLSPFTTIAVSLPDVTATPGAITVPITTGDLTGESVLSYDIQVTFDPAVVVPTGTGFDIAGTLSSGTSVASNTANAGHLIISGFQGAAFSGAGTLLNLKFTVQNNLGSNTALTFQDYTDPGSVLHRGFRFNEGTPAVSLTNGSVTVPAATATSTDTPTPTATETFTPTATSTSTFTPSSTSTSTATSTATNTPTPSGPCGTGGPVEINSTAYATLKAGFDAINAGTHTGALSILVCANTTETASAVLNASGTGSASYTSASIAPFGGSWTVSGAIAGHLVDLNGADNVSFSCSSNLTFDNTSATATTSTLRFRADAVSNTVNGCTVKGAGTSATSGTVLFDTGTTTGNTGNVISNNTITTSTTAAANGIYSAGTSVAIPNTVTVSGNNIQDYFSATVATAGINAVSGSTGWSITGNKLFQTATRVYTASNTHNGINVGSGSGYTITGNTIGFANSGGTGTTNMIGNTVDLVGFPGSYAVTGTANATRYIAINAAFAAGGTVSNIQNNTVAGFYVYTSSGAGTTNGILCGINITSGNANVGTTTGNTIGSTSGQGSIYAANTAGGGAVVGIFATSTNTVTIQNNTIGAIDSVGTTTALSGAFTGIDSAGAAGIFNISTNTIGNSTADNIRTGYTLSGANLSNAGTLTSTTGTTSPMVGIRNSATGTTLAMGTNILRGWVNGTTAGGATSGIISTGANTTSVNISSNQLGTSALGWMRWAFANTGGSVTGVQASGVAAAATLTINSNDFRGIVYTVSGASSHTYMTYTHSSSVADNVNNNTFTNLNVNTTGSVTFMVNSGSRTATGSMSVSSNSIVTGFNKGGAGGSITCMSDGASSSVTGATALYNLNNFSNITLTGATSFVGFTSSNGSSSSSSQALSVTNNTFSNVSTGSASMTGISYSFSGSGTNVTGNTLSNISNNTTATALTLTGVSISSSSNSGTQSIANNTISGLASNGTGGQTIGILGGATTVTTLNITGNKVSGITTTSTAGPVVAGIFNQSTGATTNIIKNKVYDVSNAAGAVIGINSTAAAATNTINLTNNYVGRIYATASAFFQAERGMLLQSTVAATYNVYYNTVYLDGTTPTQTYCLYIGGATVNVPNVNPRNNIFVNNVSSSNGATLPQAAYFRLGATNATNLAATANNNLLYAGTPAADHLIYVDGAVNALTNPQQTLAGYKTLVGPTREAASVTESPTFQNTTNGALATYLHINGNVPTAISNGAVNIAGITDDYDGDIRFGNPGYAGNGTAPDIGADEFDTPPPCAGATAGTASGATTICGSGSATLSATGYSTGFGTGYQWEYSNDNFVSDIHDLTGQTNPDSASTGTISATTYYRLRVTCPSFANSYSNVVTVTVNTPPTASVSPAGPITLCAGGTQLLTATTNSGSPSYQWKKNGVNISLETNSTYTASTSGNYTVVVTDGGTGCPTTSNAVSVTIQSAVVVAATATPSSVPNGGNSQLSAAASQSTGFVSNYLFSSLTGQTYTTLTGGGVTTINTAAQLTTGFGDATQDDGGVLVTLPFNFSYMGSTSNKMSMSTNGWLGAGDQSTIDAANSRTPGNLFTTAIPNKTIGAWFKDMGANFPVGTGSMRHGLIGTDVYAFQWDKAIGSGFTDGSAITISFQINIYGPASTAPGRIDVIYGPTAGAITFGAAIGVEDATGGTPNHYLNALTGDATSTTTSTVWPGNGNGYRYEPVRFTYLWSPATFLNDPTLQNPTASGMTATTTYTVTVTSLATSCTGSDSTTVTVLSTTPTNTATATETGTATSTATATATGTATPTPGCGSGVFSYTGPPVAIPDSPAAGINLTIPVTGLGVVNDVNFRFDGTQSADPLSTLPGINHSWVGDLRVTVTAPGGQGSVVVFDRPGAPATANGCNSNNLGQLTLDDQGGFPPVENQCGADTNAAFPTGTFSPNNPLSVLNGINPNGDWVINIVDLAGGDTGSARALSLVIEGGCATATATNTSTPSQTPTNTDTPTPTSTTTPTNTATPTSTTTPTNTATPTATSTPDKFFVNTTADTQDATPGDGICDDGTGNCSLRAAITEANANVNANTISLPAGTYTETLVAAAEDNNAGGDFDIRTNVIINGSGSGTTFVEANAAPGVATERVFHILAATATTVMNVNINNLTVRNGGNGTNLLAGAGIRVGASDLSTYTFDHLVITDNRNPTSGGGLAISGPTTPTVNITDCTISNNTAGSAIAASDDRGAGLYNAAAAGAINVTNTTISGNVSTPGITAVNAIGGGYYTQGAATTFTNSTITNNTARVIGAGFSGGVFGGGISALAGSITFNGSTVSNNTALVTTGGAGSATGGGMYTQSTATMTLNNTSFTGNACSGTGGTGSAFGGGITVQGGTVIVQTNSSVSNNTSSRSGGSGRGFAAGIYNQQAALSVIDSSVTGNTASDFHAGIRTLASTGALAVTNITRSTISGNTANGNNAANGEGGGVVNIAGGAFTATTNIASSTVSGNHAWAVGAPGAGTTAGGIENYNTSSAAAILNLTNSTVSGNDADAAGGIYTAAFGAGIGTLNVDYSTIARNDASDTGGGIYQEAGVGVTNLKDSVIADNTAVTDGFDIFGTITSQNYNHIEDTTGATFVPMGNDVTGSDPLLGPLANNGGTTQTHLPGWPVADLIPSGTNGCGTTVALDQRGLARPFNGACDKGSVESQSVLTPSPTATNTSTPTATSTATNTSTPTFTPTPTKFFVNTTADTQDAAAGDGNCLDGSGNCSLRAAITESNALGGTHTISLPAGTYTETLVAANEDANAGGDFDISSNVIINGSGSGTTFVQSNAAPGVATERVFHIRGATAGTALSVNINNLTVRNGGGNNAIAANINGAGIRIDQGTGHNITLDNMVFTANAAVSRGGAIALDAPTSSTVNVTNCTISGNTAGSALAGTAARGAGITVGAASGSLNITNTSITGNTAVSGLNGIGALGGGLYSGGAETITISNSSISNNTANTAFPGSTGQTSGGGIAFLTGTVTLQNNSVVSGNTASATNGVAFGLAGAILNQQATLNVIDSSVTNNTASDFRGGIYSLAISVPVVNNITRSTISGNTAQGQQGAGAEGDGGGIATLSNGATASSTTTITSSTISGNHAWVGGAPGPDTLAGAIENVSFVAGGIAVVNLTNSTVSGNDADNAGGIFNQGAGGTINLDYSTVAANDATIGGAGGGGGLYNTTGTINLKDSVVADNTAPSGPDIIGTITSQDYNHVQDTTDGTFAAMANDMVDTTAAMGALANNGGTTQTHLPGYPVINLIPSGTNGCGTTVALDQRGQARPFGAACDKGSVEIQTVLTPSPTNTATPTATSTNTSTPTDTPTPTATSTATATATDTPTPASSPVISGTVTYGNAAAPPKYISNATVTGTGSPNVLTTTDAPGGTAGQYALTGFGAGSYTVSVSKTTGQNGISSNDCARIAQHVAGILLFTNDNQRVAADASNNGVISSNDAALIARYVAGLGAPIGISGTWRFFLPPGPTFPVGASPTSRTYPSVTSSISGEDYVGLLMGEVTGNWAPSNLRPVNGPQRSTAVDLPHITAPIGNDIVIPISVQGADDKGIISYEFNLRYDPSVIQPLANPVDLAGTVSSGLTVVANPNEPGLLRVVVYGPLPIEGNGVLLNLRFTAVGAPGSVSPLTWERLMLNEGDPQALVTDGQIELSAATAE